MLGTGTRGRYLPLCQSYSGCVGRTVGALLSKAVKFVVLAAASNACDPGAIGVPSGI
jgi:hypothetical protein